MKPTQQIAYYQEKIEELRKEISSCSHDFDKPKYDPDYKQEGYGGHYVGHGSDPVYQYAGYTKKEIPRWSRECKICGCKEYTTQTENVVVGKQPKF